MSDKNADKRALRSMMFYITIFSFAVMSLSALFWYGALSLAVSQGWWSLEHLSWRTVALVLLVASIILSAGIIKIFGERVLLTSIKQLSAASKKVAAGDFAVRVPVPRERDMAELAQNFNSMAEQLGRQEMLSEDFISGVSHEFRNPLTAISGYAQLLSKGGVSGEREREYLGVIERKASALSRLVSDILDLSRLEHSSAALTVCESFSLDEQLRRCALQLEPLWSAKGIDMRVSLDPAFFYGCERLLAQVWTNLLDNAIKFTPRGGEVSLRLSDEVARVVVRVSDSGIGMDEATRERMFDKFFQGDGSKSGQGNGLGLSIAKRILKMHSAEIEVRSAPGEGTDIAVTLPRSDG